MSCIQKASSLPTATVPTLESCSESARREREWRPVSREFPVHIRPLGSGECELAVLLSWEQLYLPPEVRTGSGNDPAELVKKVVESVAASFRP
jgi:hypothetical protein